MQQQYKYGSWNLYSSECFMTFQIENESTSKTQPFWLRNTLFQSVLKVNQLSCSFHFSGVFSFPSRTKLMLRSFLGGENISLAYTEFVLKGRKMGSVGGRKCCFALLSQKWQCFPSFLLTSTHFHSIASARSLSHIRTSHHGCAICSSRWASGLSQQYS